MKISKAVAEYLELMGRMFKARLEGKEENDILDEMDAAWMGMTPKEIEAMEIISRVLGIITIDEEKQSGV